MRATILALTLITTPALADWRETCGTIGELAETVMERRQEGTSMSKMMGVITEDAADLAEPIVIDAYEQPRYSTPEVRRRTIENFRDKWYLWCARNARE